MENEQGNTRQPISGEFEASHQKMVGDFAQCDPSLQQQKDDEELLKNIGDSYTRIQKGTIYSSDGETKIPVDLTFTRIRNKKGGVDVVCTIPCLAATPEMTMGK